VTGEKFLVDFQGRLFSLFRFAAMLLVDSRQEKGREAVSSRLSTVQKLASTVSVREQSLGKLGDHSTDADHSDGTPKINPCCPQMIGGPDQAQRMEKFTPFGFTSRIRHAG
jgi:hypothetical protein